MKGTTLSINGNPYDGDNGDKITGIWKSTNTFGTTIPSFEPEQSCQVSSAMWCWLVLKGKKLVNPNADITVKKKMEGLCKWLWGSKGTHKLPWTFAIGKNKYKADSVLASKYMSNLLQECEIQGCPIVKYNTNEDLLKKIITKPLPCLIWMRGHMVAVYPEKKNKIYYYDNTIGLVLCEDLPSLISWIKWVNNKNDEPSPSSTEKWTCLQCLKHRQDSARTKKGTDEKIEKWPLLNLVKKS